MATKKVTTTLNEDFETLGLPIDMGDSARMVGIPRHEQEAQEGCGDKDKDKDDEKDDDDDEEDDVEVESKKKEKKSKSEGVDDDPIDGEYATKELFDRIRALPFENMEESDYDELIIALSEKKIHDDDADMIAEAKSVLAEVAANRLRRFRTGSTARKMAFMCPQGKRAEGGGDGGRPRCVPSFRKVGSVGKLNREARKKVRWGRSGGGVISGLKSKRVDKRRAPMRGEGLMSPLAMELSAVTEGVDIKHEISVRDEIIERAITILTFLNEEFADKSVEEIYNESAEMLLDTYEAGRLDEDVMNEDDFIAELDTVLSLITRSIAKLEDEELGNE